MPSTARPTPGPWAIVLDISGAHAVLGLLDEPGLETLMNPLIDPTEPRLNHSDYGPALSPDTPQQRYYGRSGWETLVDSPSNDRKRLEIGRLYPPRIRFDNLSPIPPPLPDLSGCRDHLEVVWKERPSLVGVEVLDVAVDGIAAGRERWVSVSGREVALRERDGTIVRRVSTSPERSPPTFFALSSDDQTFVTAHDDGSVLLWDESSSVATTLVSAENSEENREISALDFDNGHLVLAYDDGSVILISDEETRTLLTHSQTLVLVRLMEQELLGWDGETLFRWSLTSARVEGSRSLPTVSALGRALTAVVDQDGVLLFRQGRLAEILRGQTLLLASAARFLDRGRLFIRRPRSRSQSL